MSWLKNEYTFDIIEIYHTVNRLRSFLSSCHHVILWSCHQVIMPLFLHFQCFHELTDNIRTSKSASQTNIKCLECLFCILLPILPMSQSHEIGHGAAAAAVGSSSSARFIIILCSDSNVISRPQIGHIPQTSCPQHSHTTAASALQMFSKLGSGKN